MLHTSQGIIISVACTFLQMNVSACLPVCLSACLSVCLSVCLLKTLTLIISGLAKQNGLKLIFHQTRTKNQWKKVCMFGFLSCFYKPIFSSKTANLWCFHVLWCFDLPHLQGVWNLLHKFHLYLIICCNVTSICSNLNFFTPEENSANKIRFVLVYWPSQMATPKSTPC